MQSPDRGSWLILLAVAGILSIPGVFLWTRVSGPSDGSFLPSGEAVWKPDGVVITPLEEQLGGLRRGDLVVAIEGQSMEMWAQALFKPGVARPNGQFDLELIYTVSRDGRLLRIPVQLGHYHALAVLARNYGVLLFLLANLLIPAFVFSRRPRFQPAQLWFLSAACFLAGGTAWILGLQVWDLARASSFWLYKVPLRGAYLLGWAFLLHMALIYPERHFLLVKHSRTIPLIYIAPFLLYGFFLFASRPLADSTLAWLGWWSPAERALDFIYVALILIAIAQSYRRARGNTLIRLQLRWIVLTWIAFGVFGIILGYSAEIFLGRPLVDYNLIVPLFGIPFLLAMAVSILRHRLFDIEIFIHRALVYGALTAVVALIYVLVVGYLGAIFQPAAEGHALDDLGLHLLAAALIAILFQPLRDRLQRAANRLMYGERDAPYSVLTRLSQRLKGLLAPESVLPTIVETVAQALNLPYAAIRLKYGEEYQIAAEYGRPRTWPTFSPKGSEAEREGLVLPLIYQSETIGQLLLGSRGPGEAFTSADRRLLEDIADQAGVVAYTVRLTADLQRSRERLVTVLEEERRRLRRDLHDGLGSQLASLSFNLDAARNLMKSDPETASALLVDLKAQTQSAIADIRRLVYGLRPPALDELGLVAAIRERVMQSAWPTGLRVSIEAPEMLPSLPAAVEVAAFRIALEGLTNVIRHAKARNCLIRLSLDGQAALRLDICDDGQGLPDGWHPGVGLTAMRERISELGGSFQVEAVPSGGTRVVAQLPLPSSQESR